MCEVQRYLITDKKMLLLTNLFLSAFRLLFFQHLPCRRCRHHRRWQLPVLSCSTEAQNSRILYNMYVYCILLSCQAVGFPKDLAAADAAPSPSNSAPCFNKTRTFCLPHYSALAIGRHLDVLAKLVQAKPPRRRVVRRAPASKQQTPIIHMRARVPVSE